MPIAEDAARPFEERQARPILIWRHLVASGIDPAKIAVYSQLAFTKDAPPPASFNLFGGADRDYDRFMAGGFEHIIFNLALQAGWDDPQCGFGYVAGHAVGSVVTAVSELPGKIAAETGKLYEAGANFI